jgi:hypothetical protein
LSVLVVGAGRSGTSALTAALEAMGLFVGPPTGLVGPSPQNPEGFFELRAVVQLNEELLNHLGGAWDCPPELTESWFADPGIGAFLGRAQELVIASFGQRQFVLKDPRLALLLPFWRRVLLDRCCAVMIVRDPAAVAWSLSLSFGWSAIASLTLWSAYNRSAVAGLSGLPVHVCSYDELLENPVEVLTSICASLHDWDEIPKDADFDAAVARINPGLRRDTWPRSQTDFVTPPGEFISLAEALMEKRGRHDSFDSGNLPEVGSWQRSLLEERRISGGRLRTAQSAIEALRDEYEARQTASSQAIESLNATCEDLRAQSSGLRAELSASRTELERVRSVCQRRSSEADAARDDLERLIQSRTFRYTSWLRIRYATLRRGLGLP